MHRKNLFDGDSYKAQFALITYRWLMSHRWVSYADIMADYIGVTTKERKPPVTPVLHKSNFWHRLGTSWCYSLTIGAESGRVGHENDLFISIFPIERQEFRQIHLVELVVWDLSQHVLHPGPRVNIGSLAGAYERIYDCRTIRRCVIATEQIVAPAQSQRSDGILNEIVVNVDSTVVLIARQPGQQGVRVFDRFTHLAVGKDLQICLFHPRLKEPLTISH